VVEGDVFFVTNGAGKDLDQGLSGEFFIRMLGEEAQGAGTFQMEVV